MICRFCGNEMNDGAAFCPHCGAANGAPAPSYPSPEAPVGGGGKKKTGLLIGGAVAAAAVIALIVAAAAGLFANPKKQVEAAFVKSAAAYAAAEEKLGMPDLAELSRQQSYSQRMALTLNSLNSQLIGYDMDALSGLGLRMSADLSGEDRYMGFELEGFWGDEELLSVQMAADDDEMYFRSPQFTGETSYGVNTETLGADLTKLTGDDSMDGLSFNLFDLVDLAMEHMDPEKLEQSIRQANKTLWAEARVKKTGGKTLSLNGTETKTTAYQVTFPQEALDQYVDDMTEVISAINYFDLYEELFRSMGIPEEELEDFLDELEEMDVYGMLADVFHDTVNELGDLELEVCLSGGCISAISYEGRLWNDDTSLVLYLGGNKEYVDDLTAVLKVNSTEITLESSGDHGLKDGTYTDDTTIRVRQSGATAAKITSELFYDPKVSGDNFQWKLDVNSSGLSVFSLDTEGTLTAEEQSLSLDLDNIFLRVMGMEVCNLSFEYKISRSPEQMTFGDARLITEMDMTELAAFANELQNNAQTWLLQMQGLLVSRLPAELLYSMMY